MLQSIPEPDEQALAVSRELVARIREELDRSGGWIGFERYMQRALYEPGLGYYSGGSSKFGAAGDFVTAPELSDVFGRALAREIGPILESSTSPVILEVGAGSGRLAESILAALDEDASLRPSYQILEPSADLRERQRTRLAPFEDRLTWLDQLPDEAFDGVIVANEVLDAFPVKRFVKSETRVSALGVGNEGGNFIWTERPADPELQAAVDGLESSLGYLLPVGFRSEFSPHLAPWIASLADVLRRGAMLIIDYGLVAGEYYHPSRYEGTLQCHYRHRVHSDPFLHPGLQDISAWVDFSACTRAATAAGLNVAGFTTQGQFLLEGGAAELLPFSDGIVDVEQAQAFKTLVLPGEMGERFKVLLLTRDVEHILPGRDLRDRL